MRSLRPARRHRRHRPAPWKSGGIARPASAPVRVKPNSWSGCAPERAGARRPSDKICSAGTSNSAADRGRQRRPPIAHILPIVIVAKDLASLDASGDAMLQYTGCFQKGASRHDCPRRGGGVASGLEGLERTDDLRFHGISPFGLIPLITATVHLSSVLLGETA